jgi:hypothetical protein
VERRSLPRLGRLVDDDEIPYLGISETADGRLIQFTSYDLDQFEQAFSDLDARWTDDFTSVDHRPIGMGERTADEWLRSLPPMDAE